MREDVINGVATRTYVHAARTMVDVFERSRGWGEGDAVILGDRVLSYRALRRAAIALAAAMKDRCKITKGDRVAIAMRNVPEWPICFWACVISGIVAVPLNAWWTADEMTGAIADCDPKLVFADADRAALLACEPKIPTIVEIATSQADSIYDIIGPPEQWDDLPGDLVEDLALAPDDLLTIFYTSGTTGRPKGVMGTHRNMAANIVNVGLRTARAAVRRGEPFAARPSPKRILLPTPFFHVTGTHSGIVPAMNAGSTLILMERWRASAALELASKHEIQTMVTVPTMTWQLLQEVDTRGAHKLRSLETLTWGGSSATAELHDGVLQALPGRFVSNGYGMTETSSIVASNSAEDMAARPDSVGTIMPCNDVRIVDPSMTDVPANAPGELLVRGINIVSGYWRNPEATSEATHDGWWRTGDIARLDPEGFLYVIGRVKDMLIRGGENVLCGEVEGVLVRHPSVEECAVIGLPHATLGEEVAAIVRLSDPVSDEELQAHAAASLAHFKVPTHIIRQEEPLERNAVGKIVKAPLRSRYGLT
jgi:long-chain acyl-CoA synthetase